MALNRAFPVPSSVVRITGSSPTSFAEAARAAVAQLGPQDIRTAYYFDVVSEDGTISGDKVQEFQVTLDIWYHIR